MAHTKAVWENGGMGVPSREHLISVARSKGSRTTGVAMVFFDIAWYWISKLFEHIMLQWVADHLGDFAVLKWAIEHPYQLFLLLGVSYCVAVVLLAQRKSSSKTAKAPQDLPAIKLNTEGDRSPAIAQGSGTQNIYLGDRTDTGSRKRPILIPLSFGKWGSGDLMFHGYREGLFINNHGDTAYEIQIDNLEVGEWIATFEPLPILKENHTAHMLVSSIQKTTCSNGVEKVSAQHQHLCLAWDDAFPGPNGVDRLPIRIRYKDYQQGVFYCSCAIVRDFQRRNDAPFRIADYVDGLS